MRTEVVHSLLRRKYGGEEQKEIIASSCKHTRMCSNMFVCIHQHNLRNRSESQ
jgi:hypothetical protein